MQHWLWCIRGTQYLVNPNTFWIFWRHYFGIYPEEEDDLLKEEEQGEKNDQ